MEGGRFSSVTIDLYLPLTLRLGVTIALVQKGVLDFELEVPCSILTGDNILSLEFFSFCIDKPLMLRLALLPMLCVCEKLECVTQEKEE